MQPTSGRVLCADDDEDTRFMLSCLLESYGFSVETAGTLARAGEVARRQPFDLFLLDRRFLDGSGLDLCRELRLLAPLTPVVFFSGLVEAEERRRGIEAGACDYLVKPDNLGGLANTLARRISESRAGVAVAA